MRISLKLSIASILTSLSLSTHAVTIGQKLNPAEPYFLDCNTAPAEVKLAGASIQQGINQKLAAANIALESDGILYNNVDYTGAQLTGGCSRNTRITSQAATIKLKTSSAINLSGNAISKPALFALTLPVQVDIRVGFESKTGANIPFSNNCSWFASDSYNATGTITTTAKMLAFLSLEPKYRVTSQGDYVFALKPTFDIQAGLANTELNNLDFHGVNPVFNVYSSLLTINSATNNLFENLLKGESVKNSYNQFYGTLGYELGFSTLLTNDYLGHPILIDDMINHFIDKKVDKMQKNINDDINSQTQKIKNKLAQSLGVGYDGMLYYVLGPNLQPKAVLDSHRDFIKGRLWVGSNNTCGQTYMGGGGYGGSYSSAYRLNCDADVTYMSKMTNNGICSVAINPSYVIEGNCDNFTVYRKI